jgi:hypothetical protein
VNEDTLRMELDHEENIRNVKFKLADELRKKYDLEIKVLEENYTR